MSPENENLSQNWVSRQFHLHCNVLVQLMSPIILSNKYLLFAFQVLGSEQKR